MKWFFTDRDNKNVQYGPFKSERDAGVWNMIHRNVGENRRFEGIQGYSAEDLRYLGTSDGKAQYPIKFKSHTQATYPVPLVKPVRWEKCYRKWLKHIKTIR